MSRMSMFLSSLGLLVLAVGLAGCAEQQPKDTSHPPATGAQPPAESGGAAEPEGVGAAGAPEGSGHAERGTADPEVEKALAELSSEDRALAEKQKICPVSEMPLGSMGVPVKVNVKGQDVFLCCDGCKDSIEKNPDEYLAKLK